MDFRQRWQVLACKIQPLSCDIICKRIFSNALFQYIRKLKDIFWYWNLIVLLLFFYCTACQHPEEWPASTYGYLKGVSLTFQMLAFERISWFGGKGIGKYQLWYNIIFSSSLKFNQNKRKIDLKIPRQHFFFFFFKGN